MAFLWLESTFHNSQPLSKKPDCLVIFVHWKLLSNGYLVLHSKQGLNVEDAERKELLPENWNSEAVYELQYVKNGEQHLLKAVVVDRELVFTVVRVKDEKAATLVLDTDRWIGENFQSFNEAYKEKVTLDNFVQKELVDPFLEKVSAKPSGTSTIIIDEKPQSSSTGAPSYPSASSFPDPFAVGGGDLNPLGRGLGGGGMLMDPRHMGRRPPLGIPGNLPPGAVPPGARFDPFGPIGNIPPVRGPRPSVGGFGDPDFDHLPPPGSHDMFM